MDIFPIRHGISTAYLAVRDDTAMLIDAAEEPITPKVLAKLTDLKAHLRLIVLTHFHYDHVGAADSLRRATGAPVAIHRLDADQLRRGGRLAVTPTRLRGWVLAPMVRHGDRTPVTPDLEFGDDENLEEYGGFGRAFLTPGHTPGSQSVQLPNGTLLVGDALSETVVPRHLAQPPLFADHAEDSKRSITAIAAASRGDVRVAHIGRVTPASLDKLAHRAQTGQLTY